MEPPQTDTINTEPIEPPQRVTINAEPIDAAAPPAEETPAKSGKKPKKKKLTKEERKARKLLAEQEFKKLELRTKLRVELELSKKTARKGHESWEEMCREVKVTEMREELMEWHAKSNRLMEQKDKQIERMLDDIDQTKEMAKLNFAKQAEIIDYIINSFRLLLDCSRKLYESFCSMLIQDFHNELQERLNLERNLKLRSENIMHASSMLIEKELFNDFQIFLERRDDVVNSEIEKRYKNRDSVVEKMKLVQRQLLVFVKSLINTSLDAHKYERIDFLAEKQKQFMLESKKLDDTEFRSNRVHAELQRDYLHAEVDAQRKVNDLKMEHAYFMKVRTNIENKIEMDRQITFEKLRAMTSESYKVQKHYKRLEKYGELLLVLAAQCRKLETEKEKIVPWATNPEDDIKIEDLKFKQINLQAHLDLDAKELQEEMKVMKKFWHRQSLVELQNLLLKEEKKKLNEENQRYRDIIKNLSKTDNVDELKSALTVVSVKTGVKPCAELFKQSRTVRHSKEMQHKRLTK